MQYEFLWDAAYEYICVGGNVLKHRVKTLPTISKGINPGFTLSGPTSVHVGNVNVRSLHSVPVLACGVHPIWPLHLVVVALLMCLS